MTQTYLYRDRWITLNEAATLIGCTPLTVRKRISGHAILDDWDRSDAVVITHGGDTRSVTEWAAITGLTRATIYTRLFNGWSADRALTTPPALSGRGAPKARNRRSIKRIVRTFRGHKLASMGITGSIIIPNMATGGYIETSTIALRTGAPRVVRDLQSHRGISA